MDNHRGSETLANILNLFLKGVRWESKRIGKTLLRLVLKGMADPERQKSGKALEGAECAFCYAENMKHSPNRKGEAIGVSGRKEESARSDSPILEPHTRRV